MSDDDFQDDHIDFEEPAEGGGFEDFEGGGSTLGDMWRNNPLVKIGVIAGGLITVIAAVILFGGAPEQTAPSAMLTSEGVKEAPGQGQLSEAYREALVEENISRVEQARREGTSAMPTPIDAPVDRLTLPDQETQTEDPLERWRRIQEERQRQVSQKTPETVAVNPHAESIDALATAMASQMEGILTAKKAPSPVSVKVTQKEFLEELREEEAEAAAQSAASVTADGTEIVNILIPSGTIEYAQMILEANSDIEDGPVLAHLVSGPLAGSKLLGSFEAEDEYLVLTFNVIVIDGIAHATDAIAIDPDTTLPAMATEVDKRYFSRVILPAAAAFLEGVSEAIGQSGSTTVVVDGGAAVSSDLPKDTREEFFSGLEKAGEKLGEIMDENAEDIEPLVRVEAGTPMGVLFIQPVTDESS